MKRVLGLLLAGSACATSAAAGGLDRTGQPIGIIFEEGNYFEFSYGRGSPDLSGTDNATGLSYGDVAGGFGLFGAGIKFQYNEKLSFAAIFDQPFGADIFYPVSPTTPLLSGTLAEADSSALTALARYEFTERFSAHGGVRMQSSEGEITLSGLAYGGAPPAGLNGYNVQLSENTAFGYVLGAAYEIPDIALRFAVTYNSAIEHDFDTSENIAPGLTTTTDVETPQSVNIDFQTGIAKDTLLFAGIRWAEWSTFKIRPTVADVDLVDLDDTTTFSIGLARRFTDQWSGSITLAYEEEQDPLVSPLAPSTGFFSIGLGGQYTKDNMKISAGIRYTMVGDAEPETGTPDTARANFDDNDAVSAGIRVGFSF